MYRFLFRPRWIAGHVLVIVAVVVFVNLGLWQLRRLEARQAYNARVTQQLEVDAVPLDDVALVGSSGSADGVEFRRVAVTGRFRSDAQILTAPRTIAGEPGQQVLGVLERGDGPAVLVDRGWIPYDSARTQAPPVPTGRVQIDGVVRAREPRDAGEADQVVQIVPSQISQRLGQALLPVYVQLRSQQPAPAVDAPRPTPLPELSEGSHRSYAIQWFVFALIVLVGYPALLWRTARHSDPPGTPPHDAVDRDLPVSSAVRR